jgi:hypothetical protein
MLLLVKFWYDLVQVMVNNIHKSNNDSQEINLYADILNELEYLGYFCMISDHGMVEHETYFGDDNETSVNDRR